MDNFNDIIFDNKTFGDIIKEIYTKSNKKEKTINGFIQELKPLINDIGDAMLLVPLISSYLDMSIKNDNQLIALANIIQKQVAKAKNSNESLIITDEEKAQLLSEIKKIKD